MFIRHHSTSSWICLKDDVTGDVTLHTRVNGRWRSPGGHSDGVGGIWVFIPPKSTPVNFLCRKNDIRMAIQQFYSPSKTFIPPQKKQIYGYAPNQSINQLSSSVVEGRHAIRVQVLQLNLSSAARLMEAYESRLVQSLMSLIHIRRGLP